MTYRGYSLQWDSTRMNAVVVHFMGDKEGDTL